MGSDSPFRGREQSASGLSDYLVTLTIYDFYFAEA